MFPSSLHQFLFPLTSTVSRCVFGLAREPDNWLLQRQIRVSLRCRKPLSQLVQHWFHHFPSLWSVCWRHRGDRCSEHEPACEKKKNPQRQEKIEKARPIFFPIDFILMLVLRLGHSWSVVTRLYLHLLNTISKLGSHQSRLVYLAREPGLVMWAVVPLLCPSIHPRQVLKGRRLLGQRRPFAAASQCVGRQQMHRKTWTSTVVQV